MRTLCRVCLRPIGFCYCSHIRLIDPQITFVILIHPIEQRRPIATGRMAHLALQKSILIPGEDYSNHEQVNRLIEDPKNRCVILYPKLGALNLTDLDQEASAQLIPRNQQLVIFVIDGTWNTARKTMRLSRNLNRLPHFCFTPTAPSLFRVRCQPKPHFYSTIEAIDHTLKLLGKNHESLLTPFHWMVETQLASYPVPSHRHVRKRAS